VKFYEFVLTVLVSVVIAATVFFNALENDRLCIKTKDGHKRCVVVETR
jgi:hypothetical protein